MIITFIGGGNMASALINGLASTPEAHELRVADPDPAARERLADRTAVRVFGDGREAVAGADVVVLAVKPQVLPGVLGAIAPSLGPGHTLVSVAAGITVDTLQQPLREDVPVVRTMPNTPALLGLGITGLYADARCDAADRAAAELVLGACGEIVWLDEESQLDTVTAVSGSGPAYYYLFTEALADAGTDLGLPRETARRLAVHTARGAGAMMLESDAELETLRRRVTSPGGTTQAAIERFEAGGLRTLVADAAGAAVCRGRELAREGAST